MKCPLLRGVMFKELPGITLVPLDCLRDKCSWWEHYTQMCSILVIATNLANIHYLAGDLVEQLKR